VEGAHHIARGVVLAKEQPAVVAVSAPDARRGLPHQLREVAGRHREVAIVEGMLGVPGTHGGREVQVALGNVLAKRAWRRGVLKDAGVGHGLCKASGLVIPTERPGAVCGAVGVVVREEDLLVAPGVPRRAPDILLLLSEMHGLLDGRLALRLGLAVCLQLDSLE